MNNYKNLYKLVVGDWSNDGHGKNDIFIFLSSHSKAEILDAYHKSVILSGVSLTGKVMDGLINILSDFEENVIPADAVVRLQGIGCNFEEFYLALEEDGSQACCSSDVFYLFMEMVRCNLPGFAYELVNLESINGYWGEFNHQIGYGVFSV